MISAYNRADFISTSGHPIQLQSVELAVYLLSDYLLLVLMEILESTPKKKFLIEIEPHPERSLSIPPVKAMSEVSIIIPCYNERSTIQLLLKACYDQTYPRENMEVIVADGMSTDGTREQIAEFQQAHPGTADLSHRQS